MLQKHRAKFYIEEDTCKLCSLAEESTTHLLVWCPALSHKWESMLLPIYQQLESWEMPPSSSNDLIQILLDTHAYVEDAYIYTLVSNAYFAITNLCPTLYSPPLY